MTKTYRCMNQLVRISHIYLYCLYYSVIALIAVVRITSQSSSVDSFVYSVLGGVPRAMIPGEIDYLAFARWMMIIAAPQIITIVIADQINTCRLFILLRINRKHVWRGAFLSVTLHASLFTIIMSIVVNHMNGRLLAEENMKIFLLLFIHILFISILLLRICLRNKRLRFFPLVVLFMEGITFIVSQRYAQASSYMPGVWAMFYQSSAYLHEGYNLTIVISFQIIALMICYAIPPKIRIGEKHDDLYC